MHTQVGAAEMAGDPEPNGCVKEDPEGQKEKEPYDLLVMSV